MDTELDSIKKEITMNSDFNRPLELSYSTTNTKEEIQKVFRQAFIGSARYTVFPVLEKDMPYEFILKNKASSDKDYLPIGITTNLLFDIRNKNKGEKPVATKQSIPVLKHSLEYNKLKEVTKVIELPTKEKNHVVQSDDKLIKDVLKKNTDLGDISDGRWREILFTAVKGKAITRDSKGTLVEVHVGKYESLQLIFKLVAPPTN